MLAPFLALRPSALGSSVCTFASGAAWRCQSAGILMDVSPAMAVALSTAPTSTPSHQTATSARLSDSLHTVDSAMCSRENSISESTANTPVSPISQPATGWRTLPSPSCKQSSEASVKGMLPSSRSPLAAPCFRRLHNSSPCIFAAAPATASASAGAPRFAPKPGITRPTTSTTGDAGARPPARRQPVSRQANEFQRMFFHLINHHVATPDAPAPSSAQVSLTNSQAIRLLLAWIAEGRAARAAGQQSGQAEGQQGAVAAEGRATGGSASVAEAYRLDQQVFDRATEVLWLLFQRDGLLFYSGGRLREEVGSQVAGGAEQPMGLRELMVAAEDLLAAAEGMGLGCRKSHFDLVLELYNKMGMVNVNFRSGLAQRALNVRQRMVQQHFLLSHMSLNSVLNAVRQDPEYPSAARMSIVMKLLDRDLPVLPASSSSSGNPDSLGRMLPGTLHALMREAAREGAWPAYHKLEAVLVTRTRTQPPYDVLLEVLSRAVADGERDLAMGALKSIEQLESNVHPVRSSRPPQRQRTLPTSPASSQQPIENPTASDPHLQASSPRGRAVEAAGAGPRGPSAGWEEAQRQQELAAVRGLFAAGVETGEEAVAEKAYERIRQLLWREGPRPAAAEGQQQDKNPVKEASVGPSAYELKPAPLVDTLALLRLALERRDWPRVLGRVTALAELQSLSRRIPGQRFGRVLGGSNASLERSLSAYGGLGPLSEVLMGSEQDTVAYYSELLRQVGQHAASATFPVPFGGSPVAFGPALRAAAARRDLVSVSEIVKQMKGLGCAPSGDAFAAVIDASLRAGKRERVAGLMELMAEEGVVPTAAVWEVQLTAATEAGDAHFLGGVCERVLFEAERNSMAARQLAGIPKKVLSEAAVVAEALADTRAVTSLKLLRNRVEDAMRDIPPRIRDQQ